jgi:hypothetical protein
VGVRRENQALLNGRFVKVLQLAQKLNVLKFGQLTVAADGTKVMAHASKHIAVSYQSTGEMIAEVGLVATQLPANAEQADATPLPDGLAIPAPGTVPPAGRESSTGAGDLKRGARRPDQPLLPGGLAPS